MSINEIKKRLEKVETYSGRVRGSTCLIAISKVQSKDDIESVLKTGHRHFGENKVQEALTKWPELKSRYKNILLHLVGPLQTNKVKQALSIFDTIHSLDREKLAKKIAAESEKAGVCPELFLQINTGNEPQKAGVTLDEADNLLSYCRGLELNVVGLMCLPPANEDPEPHFKKLADIAEWNGLEKLSMGMSADFEKATMMGATHVRVGSAIFGDRES